MRTLVVLLAGLLAVPGRAYGKDDFTAGTYIGAARCSAHNCHGSVAGTTDHRHSIQNEYVTWLEKDRHARATAVLHEPLALQMARLLGMAPAGADADSWLDQTAHPEKCLDCHASNPPADARGSQFQVADGVQCEACHGPAGGWIKRHTEVGWTPPQSVRLGMWDTTDPAKTAQTCLGCHLGNAQKRVDHEMIAAGHPTLNFELDTFSSYLPAHWSAHDDNANWFGGGPWTLGQVVTLRESALHLARQLPANGWPDFTAYDCYSCHHDLRLSSRWRQDRPGRITGAPPWDPSRYVVLSVLAHQAAPDVADRLDAAVARLDRLVAGPTATPDLASACSATAATADELLERLRPGPLDAQRRATLLEAVSRAGQRIAFSGFRSAQQVAWTLDALAAVCGGHDGTGAGCSPGEGPENGPLREATGKLITGLANPAAYDPSAFARDVRAVGARLE